MAFPELLGALRQQAEVQRAQELATAEAEAQQILEAAHAALERRRSEYLERFRQEEVARARRAVSRAEKEAAEAVLSARGRLLVRVASSLEAFAATAIHDPEYRASLGAEIREALARLPAGAIVVRAHPELAGLARDATADRPDVTVEASGDVGVGFTALSPESGIEVDGTFATRLAHAWPQVAVSTLREVEA